MAALADSEGLEGLGVAVAGGLQHDRVEPPVEPEEPERRGRGLARALAVDGEPNAVGAQGREQRGRAWIPPQMHAGVVVVEARQLESPRAHVLARPGLEHRDRGLACGYPGDVELADRGEAARQVLERERPDRIAAGGDHALGEDDRVGHAASSRTRVRVPASAARAMPMPSIATSFGVAPRPGTNDWCHSSLTA